MASRSTSTNPHATALVDRYVARYPRVATKTLARKIFAEHRHAFATLATIESAIRYRRGALGRQHRGRPRACAFTPPSVFNPLNPLRLPASDERDLPSFVFDGAARIGVIADLHLPYHNLAALTLALQDGRKHHWDGILINGDLCDFHTLSRFTKDPHARNFRAERACAKAFLARLRELFPKARIVFKEGNHDERLQTFLMDRAPEIYDEEIFSLATLLGLEDLGIEHVIEKRTVMIGKLPVLHGHELPRGISAPVNPARGAFLRAKTSCMVSHSHRTSEHTETPLDRSIVTTWSTGALCCLRPRYEPNNSWNNGFAEVEIGRGGDYRVRNVRIHAGAILN